MHVQGYGGRDGTREPFGGWGRAIPPLNFTYSPCYGNLSLMPSNTARQTLGEHHEVLALLLHQVPTVISGLSVWDARPCVSIRGSA
jgi:hypothetical protein